MILRFADIGINYSVVSLFHGQSEVLRCLFLKPWGYVGISIHRDGKRRMAWHFLDYFRVCLFGFQLVGIAISGGVYLVDPGW